MARRAIARVGAPGEADASPGALPRIAVERVSRAFGAVDALRDVSLRVGPGEIHALLGRNGAGKTTMLRTIAGLCDPTEGEVWFETPTGPVPGGWGARGLVGVIGSGDRGFYLRLSGLENLVFFGRLQGLRRREAADRARSSLDAVGLGGAGGRPVGTYSRGMQRRLAVARAILVEPTVLLVDEATHDLDPAGAEVVRGLVRERADRGAAVVWTTQRLEEIRGFADVVTVLDGGRVRFSGSVAELVSSTATDRYVVRLDGVLADADGVTLEPLGDGRHHVLVVSAPQTLGDAIAALVAAGVTVAACHRERPDVEDAFLALTGTDA